MNNLSRSLRLGTACFTAALVLSAAPSLLHSEEAKPSAAAAAETPGLAKQLNGLWVLVGTPEKIGEIPTKGGRLKFINDGQWTITQAQPSSGAVVFHHGGTFTMDGDEYAETVVYAKENTAELIGQTFRFKMKVEGDTLTQIGQGNPWTEVWKRLK